MNTYIKTGKDLLNKEFITETHMIKGLLPYGLTLLVGKPKTGKSTFLYNLSFDCSNKKNNILDYIPFNNQIKVLYLSYEDNERKIQTIANQITDNLDNFYYSIDFPTMEKEGIEEIEKSINQGVSLIIIDTLMKFSPTSKNSYSGSYDRLQELHNLTKKYDVSIILTHHTRKESLYSFDDDFENILGSQGLRGLVDTTIFLNNDYIKIEGREIEETIYKVRKDGLRFKLDDYRKDLGNEDKRYIEFLFKEGRPITLKQFYEEFPNKKPSTIRNRLKKLSDDGRISIVSRGLYEIGPYYDRFYQ